MSTPTDDELEDQADLQDALEALEEAKAEGTIPWELLKAELNLENLKPS